MQPSGIFTQIIGIEFVNQTLRSYYKDVGISHETSMARTPQQNGVVERRNQTLVEVARTMLIYANAPLFLWAEAVATTFPEVAAPVPAVSTGTPSSILVDQDAPSPKELNEFELLEVWELVSRPDRVMIITLKWIYKVKLDELGGVLKNKARLVARGYHQEEGIEFEESFAPKFSKRTVDPTLFIRREGKDILLVQIYVDDIIFASTKPDLCEKISEIMCLKFKFSMMGKMSFFLGLQISQCHKGIFHNQSKYALEIIKKYGMETSNPVDTLMVEKSKLDADPQGKEVDPIGYHGMIGSLMYLTSSRPDLQFAVCMCARYQEKPNENHLHVVK
ncbi:uncharacterized mitochondrial protein-like protein [Tanacetum coccineum]